MVRTKVPFPLSTKFAITFVMLKIFTMAIVAFAVHRAVVMQFTTQYQEDVRQKLKSVRMELDERSELINGQLKQLAHQLTEDNDFRLYVTILNEIHQPYVIDYAEKYMKTMGLDALEILNNNGRVLSSGHYRSAVGVNSGELIEQAARYRSEPMLVWFNRADRPFVCLASIDIVQLGQNKLWLLGGVEITNNFLYQLSKDSSNILMLNLADLRMISSTNQNHMFLKNVEMEDSEIKSPKSIIDQYTVGRFTIPVVSSDSLSQATFYLLYQKKELMNLVANLKRNILAITGVGIIIAIILSVWRTRAVAEPLIILADKAGSLSLEKLNVKFDLKSKDEVGVLNDALARMVRRLRKNRLEIAAAEKKATQAEISAHLNHDIKNGFVPIRNVMKHWQEVAEEDPGKLAEIFKERKSTVLSSLDYLEDLTKRYSRTKTGINKVSLDINDIIENFVTSYFDLPDRNVFIDLDLAYEKANVLADLTQLRRVFENVMNNSLEALKDGGRIKVSTCRREDKVRITWEDNGPGIPKDVLEQLFKSHVTTKTDGSGIGLFNVKRILDEYNGTVAVESQPGSGTKVIMELPVLEEKG